MPSPYHKCAHPECDKLVNPRATYCRNHFPRTKEHIERQAASTRGRKHSKETRDKIAAARYSRVEVICRYCDTKFWIKKGTRNKKGHGQFCSSECAYAARMGENHASWKGGPVTYTCALCGKEVKHCRTWAKGHKNTFCSMSCRSLYMMAHPKSRGTKIEIIMEKALSQTGYDFQPQVPLCKVSVSDFYSSTYNIAIYCDGDYWHRRPDIIERDLRQNEVLQANGITVLRFWEKEINTDINSCIQRVHYAIARLVHQIPLPIDE